MVNIVSHFPTSQALSNQALIERRQRPYERKTITVRWVAKIICKHGQSLCLIRNISDGGVMVNVFFNHRVGEKVTLELKNAHSLKGDIVWIDDDCVGVRFPEKVNINAILGSALHREAHMQPRSLRVDTHGTAVINTGECSYICELVNLSQTGIRLILPGPMMPRGDIVIAINGLGDRLATVRWQNGVCTGLSFVSPIPLMKLIKWLNHHMAKVARESCSEPNFIQSSNPPLPNFTDVVAHRLP